MDGSLPGSFVHGILQARILEWVAIPFSRASSQSRDRQGSPTLQADSLASEPQGKPIKGDRTIFVSWTAHTVVVLVAESAFVKNSLTRTLKRVSFSVCKLASNLVLKSHHNQNSFKLILSCKISSPLLFKSLDKVSGSRQVEARKTSQKEATLCLESCLPWVLS